MVERHADVAVLRGRVDVAAGVPGGPAAYDNAEIAARGSSHIHPLVRYYAMSRTSMATQIADVPDRLHAHWRRRGPKSYYRSIGVAHHLALPVRITPTSHTAFVLGRGKPYKTAEVLLARRVQRLVAGLDGQAHRVLQHLMAEEHDGFRLSLVVDDVDFTPREVAVLTLLPEGLTARTIARRLVITPDTVHKHLQHTYVRTAPDLLASGPASAVSPKCATPTGVGYGR